MEEFSVYPAGRKITITPEQDETFTLSMDGKQVGSIYALIDVNLETEWRSDNGVHPSLIELARGLIEEKYM